MLESAPLFLDNLQKNLNELDMKLAIAFLALFVAYWQVKSSRKHNELSVKPILVVVKKNWPPVYS